MLASDTSARHATHGLCNDNDDELSLYPRRAAVKLNTGRSGAYARRRYLCLITRSFLPLIRCILVTTHLGVFRPGQISASLAGMSRTIDDYDSMARREIIKAKQEKATSYVSLLGK
jgi:hypothetical protein